MVFEVVAGMLIKYGAAGLFLSSFLSALFFIPGFANFLIPFYLAVKFNPYLILFFITTGTIVGESVNYYFGLFGSKHLIKQKKEIRKAEKWLNKWGELSIFIVSAIPFFPSDFVSVLVGFLRMDFKLFVVSIGLGKLFQFSLLIFGIGLLVRFLHFGFW